ncbi:MULTISPECIES: hypothetical protein [Gordonia]|uniref:Uncharacterized protein n=2 Tax=Gordonia TaxID=2053 RepID=A0A9X3I709_9ACTN|nr:MULTISPECIES: hypothetical protein [Gordonia]MCF3937097.1 hypothetical protein [Gordonia tangerina]MCX2966600.1 hypothetical protein [Gordonia aquimaris]
MNTLAMASALALVAVATVTTGAVGALIGIVSRADAHPAPVRVPRQPPDVVPHR